MWHLGIDKPLLNAHGIGVLSGCITLDKSRPWEGVETLSAGGSMNTTWDKRIMCTTYLIKLCIPEFVLSKIYYKMHSSNAIKYKYEYELN